MRVRLHAIRTYKGAFIQTLGLTMPVGFLPVNPVFCCFVETEFFCPLVHTEQQLIHKDVKK